MRLLAPILMSSLFSLLLAGPAASAQAMPNVQGASSYQGFRLPTVGGTLSYAATASGDISEGYNGAGGTAAFATLSGDVAFLTKSKVHPFSLVYSGGYFANFVGPAYSSYFQNLALSQVLNVGRWNFTLADSVSYLPQTANSGLSGVAGVGDVGVAPVNVGNATGQGILTANQPLLSNIVIGSAQRHLTGATSVSGSGSYGLSHFLGASSTPGLDSHFYTGTGNLTHRVDARTTVGGSYTYFYTAFSNFPPVVQPYGPPITAADSTLTASSVTFNYTRQLSRKLSTFVYIGPQWTGTPGVAGSGTSVNLTVNAGLTYTAKAASANVSYFRGVVTGSGVVAGAETDSVQGAANRRLTRVWSSSVSAVYARSTSIVALGGAPFLSNTLVGTAQVNRSIGRQLSAYTSYTALEQTTTGIAAAGTPLSGLSQIVAFGITYSPGVISLGRR